VNPTELWQAEACAPETIGRELACLRAHAPDDSRQPPATAPPAFWTASVDRVQAAHRARLEALLADPDAARHVLRVITDVIIYCVRAFRAAVPAEILRTTCAASRYAPAGYGFIDGCAAQLVSAEVYREFFAPLDAEILAQWPHGGMIHLCGACTQHIPAWRAMEPLRSVQLNDRATDDLAQYAAGLRPAQILYVSPTAAIPPDRVRTLTAGRPLVMQWRPETGATR